MELDILDDDGLLAEAIVIVGLLLWLSRNSPKRRKTAIRVALGLAVCWFLDHL